MRSRRAGGFVITGAGCDADANLAAAARVRGALDVGRLRAAFDGALGTGPAGELRVRRVDESSLPDAAAWEAQRPFDRSSPQARLSLLRHAPDDHVLVLAADPSAVDDESFAVLADELGVLYAGEPISPRKRGGNGVPYLVTAARATERNVGPRLQASRLLPEAVARRVADVAHRHRTTRGAVYAAALAEAVAASTDGDELVLRMPPLTDGAPLRVRLALPRRSSLGEGVARVRDAAAEPLGDGEVDAELVFAGRRPLLRLPGLACEPVALPPLAGAPVVLEVEEREGGVLATLAAPQDSPALLARLEAMLAAPAPAAAPRCLHELFAEQAERTPDAVALVDQRESMTYRRLEARASALAARLRDAGVEAETPVGICLGRSLDLCVAMLGVLAAGGAYVPLDPTYPDARLRRIVDDARCGLVVCDAEHASRVPSHCVRVDPDAGESAEPLAPRRSSPSSAAYVLYTSGSTGRPKGVVVTHVNVTRLFAATREELGFGPADVWTLFHSYAFDFSVWELWGALLHGGRLVIVPHLTARSPRVFLELLRRERVTILNQTPSAFRGLLGAAAEAGFPQTSLRLVVLGGEALDPRWLRAWLEAYGEERPRLVNMYGITETTVHVTARRIRARDTHAGGSPIGRPLGDLTVTLRDGHLDPVPQGEPGEIVVSGAGVARGYLGMPRETAERFVPDPAGPPGARAYRSGDVAVVRPAGELHFVGRADAQVKLHGYRIELGEIEAALGGEPSVAQAVAMLCDGPDGEKRLVAYVVPRDGGACAADHLRAFLVTRLPPYMVPAAFVSLDALPLTENGKLDVAALPEPEGARRGKPATPQTAAERILVEVCAQVLGLEHISADDNFFQLGGDSILALRLVAEAEKRGLAIDFEQIFRDVPLRRLAAEAEGQVAREEEPRSAAGPDGVPDEAFPLSELQVGLVHHAVASETRFVYQDLLAADVEGAFDEGALRRALQALVQRHELLRVSFDLLHPGGPLHRIHPDAAVPVEVVDLRERSRDARARAVARLEARALAATFDWTKPPLLRCCVAVRGARAFRLSLVVSHAIVDGWSYSRLATDLLLLYARELGEDVPLPPLPPVGFRDFVAAERAALTPEAAAFWKALLEGAPPPPTLRGGGGDGPERVELPVPPAAVSELQRLASLAGLPLKSLFLALHASALAEAAGRAEVVTGVVVNGRPEIEGSDLAVGLYLNSLPVRLALAGDLVDTARAALAAEAALLPHRRFPYPELHRQLGRAPFDVLFNYTHFHVYDELAELESLRVRGWSYEDRTHFPLTVEPLIRRLPDDVSVLVTRWPTAVSADAAGSFVDAFRRRLEGLA